jgi:hypothetical protein
MSLRLQVCGCDLPRLWRDLEARLHLLRSRSQPGTHQFAISGHMSMQAKLHAWKSPKKPSEGCSCALFMYIVAR